MGYKKLPKPDHSNIENIGTDKKPQYPRDYVESPTSKEGKEKRAKEAADQVKNRKKLIAARKKAIAEQLGTDEEDSSSEK